VVALPSPLTVLFGGVVGFLGFLGDAALHRLRFNGKLKIGDCVQ